MGVEGRRVKSAATAHDNDSSLLGGSFCELYDFWTDIPSLFGLVGGFIYQNFINFHRP